MQISSFDTFHSERICEKGFALNYLLLHFVFRSFLTPYYLLIALELSSLDIKCARLTEVGRDV
jgi:hypothetical protein